MVGVSAIIIGQMDGKIANSHLYPIRPYLNFFFCTSLKCSKAPSNAINQPSKRIEQEYEKQCKIAIPRICVYVIG